MFQSLEHLDSHLICKQFDLSRVVEQDIRCATNRIEDELFRLLNLPRRNCSHQVSEELGKDVLAAYRFKVPEGGFWLSGQICDQLYTFSDRILQIARSKFLILGFSCLLLLFSFRELFWVVIPLEVVC